MSASPGRRRAAWVVVAGEAATGAPPWRTRPAPVPGGGASSNPLSGCCRPRSSSAPRAAQSSAGSAARLAMGPARHERPITPIRCASARSGQQYRSPVIGATPATSPCRHGAVTCGRTEHAAGVLFGSRTVRPPGPAPTEMSGLGAYAGRASGRLGWEWTAPRRRVLPPATTNGWVSAPSRGCRCTAPGTRRRCRRRAQQSASRPGPSACRKRSTSVSRPPTSVFDGA